MFGVLVFSDAELCKSCARLASKKQSSVSGHLRCKKTCVFVPSMKKFMHASENTKLSCVGKTEFWFVLDKTEFVKMIYCTRSVTFKLQQNFVCDDTVQNFVFLIVQPCFHTRGIMLSSR